MSTGMFATPATVRSAWQIQFVRVEDVRDTDEVIAGDDAAAWRAHLAAQILRMDISPEHREHLSELAATEERTVCVRRRAV